MAELDRVDAIVFTGGIMENNADEIEMTISNMECLGIKLDKQRNLDCERGEGLISTDDSKIKLFILQTNEELQIAKETMEIVDENK